MYCRSRRGPIPGEGTRPARVLIALTFLLVAFGILAQGYLPPDDVLRHAAFGVTHRTWGEVLVGRPDALFDQSPGWHAILRMVHAWTGCDPDGLVIFSITALLLLFFASGLPFVRRWESWAMALGLLFLADPALIKRFTLGRPFILTSVVMLILLGDSRGRNTLPWRSARHLLWLLAAALATWIHGSWYLMAIAPGSLCLAGRFREGIRMSAILATGVLLGGTLTGHPWTFLYGEVAHLRSSLGSLPTSALVMELTPGRQPLLPLGLALLAALPALLKRKYAPSLKDPVLLAILATWLAGYFHVWRFYLDFCFPALALWTAWRLEEAMDLLPPSRLRVWAAPLAAAGLLMVSTLPNRGGRWAVNGAAGALDAGIPRQSALLPDPGGIAYSSSMTFFYQTYFTNPEGPWRYVLGYEPGMMKPEDRTVFLALRSGQDRGTALAPWIAKLTPRDRVILDGRTLPAVPSLQWSKAGAGRWSGRLPQPALDPRPSPAIPGGTPLPPTAAPAPSCTGRSRSGTPGGFGR